jgi:hypothetical protein
MPRCMCEHLHPRLDDRERPGQEFGGERFLFGLPEWVGLWQGEDEEGLQGPVW